MPIEAIGGDLHHLTSHLNALISSPAMDENMGHLHDALAKIDLLVSDVQPQLGPLAKQLNQAVGQLLVDDGDAQSAALRQALKEITEAARSLHDLTDLLERHPEALLRGRKADK